MNTNDYFYYLHKTPEADYTKFFEIGLIDYDKTFRIESTMEKVDENTLLHGGLEEVMKNVACEEIRTDWFGRRFTFTKDLDGQPIELKEKL